MAGQARGQITITDLNDAKTVNMFLSANQALTQVFSKDNSTYSPNFASKALVITPEIFVSGSEADLVKDCKSLTWTINGKTPTAFGASVGTTAPWALTINKNMTSDQQWHIVCEADWLDVETSLTTKTKATIDFAKVVNSGTLAFAQIVGPSVMKNATTSITLTGQLIRGGEATPDTTDVSYQWQKLDPKTGFVDITGATSSTLVVKPSDVLNIASYKVKIKDTDTQSGTANQTFTSPEFNVTDMSDPYTVRMDASNGNILVNGTGSTTVTATVLRGGYEVNSTAITYSWSAIDKDEKPLTIPDTCKVTGAPQKLIIDKTVVNRKSTFFCDVSIK